MSTTLETPSVGTIMPDIPFNDENGGVVTLRELTDGRPALVFFMRAATCPVCNAHVRVIAGMVAAGELAGVSVVIVTPGDASDIATVAGKLQAGVATVVATGAQSRAAVGLTSFMTLRHSGTFVLDEGGRVLAQRTATIPTGSFSRDEVLAALAARAPR